MGERVEAGPEALLAVLRALGAPVTGPDDIEAALAARKQELWSLALEPILVGWEGRLPPLRLCIPGADLECELTCAIQLENGVERHWTTPLQHLPQVAEAVFGDERYVELRLSVDEQLPLGYHELTVRWGERSASALILAAPEHAYDGSGHKSWGAFLPLYALRTQHDWGAGNLTCLDELLAFIQRLGGDLAGILPVLAAYLDQPFEPSPYAPVSRLFWNEFYVDIEAVPELSRSERARDLLDAPDVQAEIDELREAAEVDFQRGMALRRAVLEELAATLFSQPSDRRAAFWSWVDQHPSVRDYARFRATTETRGTTFHEWPERLRDGVLHDGDFEPQREHYHLYVQWLSNEQLAVLAEKARSGGSGLYLDLPLGVHGAGYDVWRWSNLFVQGASVGAPPDPLNEFGQDWGFPPLHPQRLRESGYRYHIDSLRTLLRLSGTLRIDHVMGMRRLYWIPWGMSPTEGVYVEYHFDELLAVLTLESQRSRTLIVGEDLGTVPAEVREAMARHNLYRMCVLPFALGRDGGRAFVDVPANAMASLNTHDMEPFAAYLMRLDDATYRELLRILGEHGRLAGNIDDPQVLCRCCLEYLAAGDARLLMVNLEDLWGETERQNMPGTTDEHPNWRRKAQLDMDQFTTQPDVLDTLRRVDELRRA
jgi:4-alpha-glucanotransferase